MRRGNVENTPPAGGLHVRHGEVGGVESRGHVDGDNGFPLFWREFFDGGYMLNAGVID